MDATNATPTKPLWSVMVMVQVRAETADEANTRARLLLATYPAYAAARDSGEIVHVAESLTLAIPGREA